MSKPIPPTLRERNRYIVFEVISDSRFDRKCVVRAIWCVVLGFLGELNASKLSLWMMDWDCETQRGLLKVNHQNVDELRSALSTLKEVDRKRVIFHVLGVSGTLKSAKSKHL